MRTKHYVKFVDLYEWAWNHEYQSTAETFVSGLSSLFNGTLDNPYKPGEKLPFIMNDEQLNEIWLDYFEEKEVMWALRYGRYDVSAHKRIETYDEAMLDIMARFGQRINEIVLLNKPRWVKLIGSTDLSYNPIENYRMVESENSTDGREWGGTDIRTGSYENAPTGSQSIDRSIKTDEVGHISVNGPVKTLTTVKDSETGKITISDIELEDKEEINAIGFARSSGVEQGKTKGATSAKLENGEITSTADVVNGTAVQNTAYATTYDDMDTDRKTGHSTVQGSVGEAETQNSISTQTHYREGTIESGNPNAYGYTDTQSFANRKDTTTFNNLTDTEDKSETKTGERTLTRSGNIGVTTSQQMVQSERDLLLSVAKVIMFEVADEVFLRTWG